MKNVKIEKEKLLVSLRTNRETHRAIFLEAQAGYREVVIERLDALLADAREGRRITSSFSIEEPMDQTRDYDRAIKMLEMSFDDVIELSEQDFRCYVMDDWSWKDDFLFSNSAYSVTASAIMGGG